MMMNTGKHKQTTKGNNLLVEIRMDLAQGMIIDKITFQWKEANWAYNYGNPG